MCVLKTLTYIKWTYSSYKLQFCYLTCTSKRSNVFHLYLELILGNNTDESFFKIPEKNLGNSLHKDVVHDHQSDWFVSLLRITGLFFDWKVAGPCLIPESETWSRLMSIHKSLESIYGTGYRFIASFLVISIIVKSAENQKVIDQMTYF